MALFASISIVCCPVFIASVVARGIYASKAEPELNTTICGSCQTEVQVSKDPATGEMRAERVKKN